MANTIVEELPPDLNVSLEQGLNENEVNERRQKYGYNEIPEKKIHPIWKFLSYFWGPIPWMIEVAVILSALVENWTDFWIISLLLLMNATVSFWEEYQATNAIEALKKALAPKAKVFREGQWKTIPARELVPGDIVHLKLGDIVPADMKIVQGDPIEVDQSALTGESLPVERGINEEIYSGSIVRQGEVEAVVTSIGKDTFFGKTIVMVKDTKTSSHFQKAILKIGNYLIIIALFLVSLILLVSLFRHDNLITSLSFALVLTVAAIPVAMPAVLSVTLAIGAGLLAKRKAIVQRLASIEEMAGIDILCSDKTGTLTKNQLKLGDPVTLMNASMDELALAASLASRRESQDTIDMAVLNGLSNEDALKNYQNIHFRPYDPVSKRSEATVKGPDDRAFKVTKGAPQVIYDLVVDKEKIKDALEEAVNTFASKGYRSLGVAKTDENGTWHYLGVLPLYDPPREDCKSTIEEAVNMGLKVKMVTGDQVAIAKETAKQINIGTNILDAKMFEEAKHHETGQLADAIETADGFAQVFPEHKYYLVETLQKRGHIVGMTGDGVNDAPALKKADAGIAVSGSTDAARSVADIVLLSPGLYTIIEAIRESRKIFQRMKNYAIYRIAETIRVLLFMTLSILVFNFYPVTSAMLVLLALLNDGAILSIAYDKVNGSNRPSLWNMRMVLGLATVLGVSGVVASFGLFYLAEEVFHFDRETIQTLIYLKLSVAGQLTIFLTRTTGPFWKSRPSNILLFAVMGAQLIATLIVAFGILMAPLAWKWIAFVWGYAFFWFLVNDQIKLAAYKVLNHQKRRVNPNFFSFFMK